MSDEEQLSLDDLMGFTPPPAGPTPEETAIKDAQRILNTWAEKSGRTKSSVEVAIELFSQKLLDGVEKETLKYAINHRTLLASKKRITASMLDKALAEVAEDKKAGQDAKTLFENWHSQWYENRYTQPVGQIISTIKTTILDGVQVEHLRAALDLLGRRQQVITGPSIQFALSQVTRNLSRREQAGAHGSVMVDTATRQEMFRSQRQTVGTHDTTDEAPF